MFLKALPGLLTLLLPFAAAANDPAPATLSTAPETTTLECQLPFLPAQYREELQAARKRFYVKVLSRQVGEKTERVVLLGEIHIQDPEMYKLGENLLERFAYVGREGIDPSKDPFVNAFLKLENLKRTLTKRREKLVDGTIGRADTLKLLNQAFDLVLKDAPLEKVLEIRAQILESRQDPERPKQVEAYGHKIDAEDLDRIALSKLDAKLRELGQDPAAIDAAAAENAQDPAAASATPAPIPEAPALRASVSLEADHVFTWRDRLYFAKRPLYNLTLLTSLALIAYDQFFKTGPIFNGVVYTIAAASWGISIYDLLETGLGIRHKDKDWYQRIFPHKSVVIDSRNKTMVRNIGKAFQDYPEMEDFLVLVGAAHVDGMEADLIAHHGFTPVALPPLPEEPSEDGAASGASESPENPSP